MKKLIYVLFVVLALPACASTIRGSASIGNGPTPTGSSSPTGAPTNTGSASPPTSQPSGQSNGAQYRTVDPCSFFNKSAFTWLGSTAKVTVAAADYSTCTLSVAVPATDPKDDQTWSVYLDMGGSYSQPGDYKTRYSITVHATDFDGTQVTTGSDPTAGCLQAFSLPDSTSVVIIAKPLSSSTKGDPCSVAIAGLTSALHNFKNNALTQLQLATGSIAAIAPCTAFATAASQTVGNSNGKPIGEHGCQWGSQQSSVSVSLESTGWPPPFLAGASAQTFTLNGHQVQYAGGAMGGRSLVTGYLDMGASPVGSQGNHDAVTVTIIDDANGGPIRQQIKKFFTAVWQSLPQH